MGLRRYPLALVTGAAVQVNIPRLLPRRHNYDSVIVYEGDKYVNNNTIT